MKKSLSLLARIGFALCAALTSCSDDDVRITGEVNVPQEIDLTKLEKWSYEVPFNIKSDSEWRIETTGDFCYAMPSEGSGNATVQLCILDNDTEGRLDGELRVIFPADEKKNIVMPLQQKCAADYDVNATDLNVGNRIYAVGYGYNTTGGYANPESVKRPILKFKEMAEEELIVLGSVNANFNINEYSSSSIEQLSNDLATKANVDGAFGKFKSEVTGSFNNNYFSSNNYEYALTFVDLAIRYVNCEANLEEMRSTDYMTAAAYKAINGESSTYAGEAGVRKLIKDYGTHLCVSARLGGRVRHSMAVDISKVTNAYDISAYAEASYAGLFVSGGGSVDEKFKQSYEKNARACDIKVNVLGGDQAAALALSNKLDAANLNAWKASIKDSTMALVAFNENSADPSLIPLYELVDVDKYPNRYNEIKNYMEGNAMAADYPSISMSYDCGTVTRFTIPSFDENGTLVKQVKIDGHVVAQICEEYIPVINKDARVKVIYPVINNQPRINMGFFIGNNSHRPARVAWQDDELVVKEYSDMPMAEMDCVYVKGASVTNTLSVNGVVDGSVSDEYMEGYRGDGNGSYPIVKIFNKYWMKEDYKGKKFRDGSNIATNTVELYENSGNYFYYLTLNNKTIAPAGWRVPTNKDFEAIQTTLIANGLTQIGKEFIKGGKLGFDARCVGYYNYGRYMQDDSKARYWIIGEKYGVVNNNSWFNDFVIIEKSGGFGMDFLWENSWTIKHKDITGMPIRFVKE